MMISGGQNGFAYFLGAFLACCGFACARKKLAMHVKIVRKIQYLAQK